MRIEKKKMAIENKKDRTRRIEKMIKAMSGKKFSKILYTIMYNEGLKKPTAMEYIKMFHEIGLIKIEDKEKNGKVERVIEIVNENEMVKEND
ncbi:MAG: hypothetical protein ACP6IY_18905 [Promethearchaeia archaeon]